eukprot:7320391-Alexandrium_andersonii.AAC.1
MSASLVGSEMCIRDSHLLPGFACFQVVPRLHLLPGFACFQVCLFTYVQWLRYQECPSRAAWAQSIAKHGGTVGKGHPTCLRGLWGQWLVAEAGRVLVGEEGAESRFCSPWAQLAVHA